MRLLVLFTVLLVTTACCKLPIVPKPVDTPISNPTQQNQLPHTLLTLANTANPDQTKGVFFYDENSLDVVFRSIGVNDSTSSNTKLWVQVLHPDIRVFADVQIDSLYGDTVLVGSTPMLEIHNRDVGTNFYELDTALLALPFNYGQLNTKRPRLFDNSIVTVHVKFYERFYSSNFRYDIERGVLKRKNIDFVGFKNIVTGDVFFVELENRYTLKSIEVRKD